MGKFHSYAPGREVPYPVSEVSKQQIYGEQRLQKPVFPELPVMLHFLQQVPLQK